MTFYVRMQQQSNYEKGKKKKQGNSHSHHLTQLPWKPWNGQ